jgi:hypothetical protein
MKYRLVLTAGLFSIGCADISEHPEDVDHLRGTLEIPEGELIGVVCRPGEAPRPPGSCDGAPVVFYREVPRGEDAGGGVLSSGGDIGALVEEPSDIPPAPRDEDPPPLASISVPAGYGHYCSMSWKDGGWGAAWDTAGNDPCGFIKENADAGGTIERAGMFSAAGYNRVTMRCSDGSLGLFVGVGTGPLAAAFIAAATPADGSEPGAGCILTAAPVGLPIFGSPFVPNFGADDKLHAVVSPGTGLDFAQMQPTGNCPGCSYTVTGAELGLGVSGSLTLVDYKGQIPPANVSWANDHLGWDFIAPLNTPVYPAAAGKVIAARWFGSPPSCPGDPADKQGEVWILHTLHRVPSTYTEKFLTSYIHGVPKAGLEAGDYVFKPDMIMMVNDTGCASGDHLHTDTIRVTNTSWHREIPYELYDAFDSNNGNGDNANTDPWEIDPAGWASWAAFDPWAWKTGKPAGAMSIALWLPDAVPPLGLW